MKKNKAEKLRKIHIWPTIFLVLFFMVFTGIALSISLAALLENAVNGKMIQGYQETRVIYELMQEADGEYTSVEGELANVKDILGDISAVYVKDGEAFVYGSNEDEAGPGMEILHNNRENIAIFMDDSGAQLSSQQPLGISADGSLRVNMHVWVRGIRRVVESSGDFGNQINGFGIVAKQAVWYVYQLQKNRSLLVKYNINIYLTDILINLLVVFGMAVLVALACLFFFVNAIRNIMNQRRVARMYYMDLETGANNFKYFLTIANRFIKHRFLGRKKYAVVHLQMQKYRSYATCYGALEAKRLLCDFDKVLKKSKKKREVYARTEKADFGYLMTYTSVEELEKRIADLLTRLQQVRDGQRIIFLAGIYLVGEEKRTIENMYNMAATARASITDDSKMGIACFTEKMLEELVWERKVLNDMDEALRNHDFKVYLQPKYSTENEQLAAAEALVRWVHKTEGFVPPNRFIPIMEANGSIMKLDDYMISQVAGLQAEWIAQGKTIVPISVNVSRAHFMREDLAEHICQLVDAYQVPHEYIELELTESVFFDDKKALIRIANRLKELGFAISMDDFGAGYSSLNSLKELPVDVVKLDAEFFRGNDEAGKGKVIVSEAISLAKKLDMKIVAEGIETREQVDFLTKENCDLIQGYYFAKPMSVEEFEQKAFEEKEAIL